MFLLPTSFPPLVGPPEASRRHSCARVQQGRGEAKIQNLRKDCLQARKAVLSSVSVPIYTRLKTLHNGPQNATQGTKQPRPTPQGASRGIIICSGRWIAPRSALCQRPTKRSVGRRTMEACKLSSLGARSPYPSKRACLLAQAPLFLSAGTAFPCVMLS